MKTAASEHKWIDRYGCSQVRQRPMAGGKSKMIVSGMELTGMELTGMELK